MPTTHTPGKWKVEEWTYPEPRGKRLVIQNSHDAIAEMYDLWCMDTRKEEMQANARLIAAAPMLYAALKAVQGAFYALADQAGDVPEWNQGGIAYEASKLVTAALAQADGREQP